MINEIIAAVLAVALVVATITDIRSRKVYNWLTFPVLALGFVLNGIKSWPHGLLFSLEGWGVACLFMPIFALSGMGAGDIKLVWAVGALMGPHFTFWSLLCTAIAGGVMAVIVALKQGQLSYTIKNALIGAQQFASTRSADSLKGMAAASKVGKMAYAPAIAAGAAIAAYLIHSKII